MAAAVTVRDRLTAAGLSGIEGDPLSEPAARDWAVRDYRTHLLTIARRKPSTVNAHLTAVDDFYRRRGLGPAAVGREDLPKAAPRALDRRAQLRWLRHAELAPPRDRALALTGFYAGTRIGETVALDVGDLHLSARKGHLIVRYGKGGKYREVPLHPTLRPCCRTGSTSGPPGPARTPRPRCSSTAAAPGCPPAAPTTSWPPWPWPPGSRSAVRRCSPRMS